jgi:hypothetical protein
MAINPMITIKRFTNVFIVLVNFKSLRLFFYTQVTSMIMCISFGEFN